MRGKLNDSSNCNKRRKRSSELAVKSTCYPVFFFNYLVNTPIKNMNETVSVSLEVCFAVPQNSLRYIDCEKKDLYSAILKVLRLCLPYWFPVKIKKYPGNILGMHRVNPLLCQ